MMCDRGVAAPQSSGCLRSGRWCERRRRYLDSTLAHERRPQARSPMCHAFSRLSLAPALPRAFIAVLGQRHPYSKHTADDDTSATKARTRIRRDELHGHAGCGVSTGASGARGCGRLVLRVGVGGCPPPPDGGDARRRLRRVEMHGGGVGDGRRRCRGGRAREWGAEETIAACSSSRARGARTVNFACGLEEAAEAAETMELDTPPSCRPRRRAPQC
ncbi:hypothetical protein B0H11DRAFT_1953725 [Mycena galericulata]|nr:hypothetical protein B0H11DRAFT_1953725 [Mycena galericulata]